MGLPCYCSKLLHHMCATRGNTNSCRESATRNPRSLRTRWFGSREPGIRELTSDRRYAFIFVFKIFNTGSNNRCQQPFLRTGSPSETLRLRRVALALEITHHTEGYREVYAKNLPCKLSTSLATPSEPPTRHNPAQRSLLLRGISVISHCLGIPLLRPYHSLSPLSITCVVVFSLFLSLDAHKYSALLSVRLLASVLASLKLSAFPISLHCFLLISSPSLRLFPLSSKNPSSGLYPIPDSLSHSQLSPTRPLFSCFLPLM